MTLAVGKRDTETALLLIAKGADVNVRDEFRMTSLKHALNRGDMDLCKALLGAGATYDSRDEEKITAEMRA